MLKPSVCLPMKVKTDFPRKVDHLQFGYPAGVRNLHLFNVPRSMYFLVSVFRNNLELQKRRVILHFCWLLIPGTRLFN